MASPKESIRLDQIEIRFLLNGGDTGGCLSMFGFLVPSVGRSLHRSRNERLSYQPEARNQNLIVHFANESGKAIREEYINQLERNL